MAKKFLTGEWRKLIMANYAIEPSALLPLLPAHTELDFYNDKCYISLVGFMFLGTRVLGIPIPLHQNFEEVNLRFYVRHRTDDGEWRRGVVFVREIVPKRAIAWVANALFGEHYMRLPMRHQWASDTDQIKVSYDWQFNQQWQSMRVTAEAAGQNLVENSEEEFITEHYWGYTRLSNRKTSQYQVEHPSWQWHKILDYDINCDAAQLYGAAFGEAMQSPPTSIFLAEGSPIIVRMGEKINRKI
jgi:hypothetical protein